MSKDARILTEHLNDKTRADIEMNVEILNRLAWPKHRVEVVLDTDTYNEIDDQYAIAYALRSDDRMTVKAIYAAPFDNRKCSGPSEGMEKSYQEIHNILTLLGRADMIEHVYRGSDQFLKSEQEPVVSEAAEDLARRAMQYTKEEPLYVIAIGAITNIASALLINPKIAERIVLIWLGGHAHHWHHTFEFNMLQDIAAARVVCKAPLAMVQLPCMGVVSAFSTTGPELEYWLRGKNKLCDYLVDITIAEATELSDIPSWSRSIWDVTAVAWLVDESFMADSIEKVAIPEYDDLYGNDSQAHLIRYVYSIDRDKVFYDLFTKLVK